MKWFLHLIQFACLTGLTGAAWVAHRPVSFDGIGGVLPGASEGAPLVDVRDALMQSAIKRSAPLEISEADLNRYLAATLKARAGEDALQRWVRFDRMVVDLEPGVAHVHFQWHTGWITSTATVDLAVKREDKVHRVEVLGGRYGHLHVNRGLLRPLAPFLQQLTESCQPEILALFQMTRIQIAKDKLALDSRY